MKLELDFSFIVDIVTFSAPLLSNSSRTELLMPWAYSLTSIIFSDSWVQVQYLPLWPTSVGPCMQEFLLVFPLPIRFQESLCACIAEGLSTHTLILPPVVSSNFLLFSGGLGVGQGYLCYPFLVCLRYESVSHMWLV